ncbi:MAG: 5'/3'-nucleotidase SurE [Bacteroidota bacterium]
MDKPLILVTNDDGIHAKGIRSLVEVAKTLGEVIVVAPSSPQSAKGHAITISSPIRLTKVDIFDGVEAYKCSGTPVDCVKLAKSVVLHGRKADLCVSGVNHGSNVAINILYSGTMSAAMEAALEGIPSIGFSLLDFSQDADFAASSRYVRQIAQYMLEHNTKENLLLNVNIPKLPEKDIQGVKVCRQAEARWVEEFAEAEDPRGEKYYWMTGSFVNKDPREDTDVKALEAGYISIVPAIYDLTDNEALPGLKAMEGIAPTALG